MRLDAAEISDTLDHCRQSSCGGKVPTMKQVLTLVVKLQPTPEQASKLAATLQVLADACNYVNDNTHPKLTNKIALQSFAFAYRQGNPGRCSGACG
ncbi:hypothetical protein [Parathermosynechococcus lividus]